MGSGRMSGRKVGTTTATGSRSEPVGDAAMPSGREQVGDGPGR